MNKKELGEILFFSAMFEKEEIKLIEKIVKKQKKTIRDFIRLAVLDRIEDIQMCHKRK